MYRNTIFRFNLIDVLADADDLDGFTILGRKGENSGGRPSEFIKPRGGVLLLLLALTLAFVFVPG